MNFALNYTCYTPLKKLKMYSALYKLNQRILRKRFYANLENNSTLHQPQLQYDHGLQSNKEAKKIQFIELKE